MDNQVKTTNNIGKTLGLEMDDIYGVMTDTTEINDTSYFNYIYENLRKCAIIFILIISVIVGSILIGPILLFTYIYHKINIKYNITQNYKKILLITSSIISFIYIYIILA